MERSESTGRRWHMSAIMLETSTDKPLKVVSTQTSLPRGRFFLLWWFETFLSDRMSNIVSCSLHFNAFVRDININFFLCFFRAPKPSAINLQALGPLFSILASELSSVLSAIHEFIIDFLLSSLFFSVLFSVLHQINIPLQHNVKEKISQKLKHYHANIRTRFTKAVSFPFAYPGFPESYWKNKFHWTFAIINTRGTWKTLEVFFTVIEKVIACKEEIIVGWSRQALR